MPDAFRLYVGDWLAYEWRFDVVRLWEIDADSALQSGEAGPLALVPLLRGGDEPKGQLRAVRQMCADLVKEFHPGVAADLIAAVEACDQPETLHSWALRCAKLSDAAFVTLVTGKPRVRDARPRATRPARRQSRRR